MREAVWAEIRKLHRSRLAGISVLAFTVAAAVGGLFMFILQDPDRARALGLLGAKAQLTAGTADWPSLLALLAQIIAVGGLDVYGLVVIWAFGREFSDHTAKDLLALPTTRATIVAAKFAVTGVWCLLLAGQTFVLGLAAGAVLRLPGWSGSTAVHGLGRLLATAAMTVLLVTCFGLAASIGRGYLAAVGVLFVTVFVAQIIAALGYGHLFPWSVPAVYSGISGTDRPAGGRRHRRRRGGGRRVRRDGRDDGLVAPRRPEPVTRAARSRLAGTANVLWRIRQWSWLRRGAGCCGVRVTRGGVLA